MSFLRQESQAVFALTPSHVFPWVSDRSQRLGSLGCHGDSLFSPACRIPAACVQEELTGAAEPLGCHPAGGGPQSASRCAD